MTTGNILSLQNTAAAATATGHVLDISNTTTGAGYGVYSAMLGHGNTGYAGYFNQHRYEQQRQFRCCRSCYRPERRRGCRL